MVQYDFHELTDGLVDLGMTVGVDAAAYRLLFQNIGNVEEELRKCAAAFEFQGFSPDIIVKTMKARQPDSSKLIAEVMALLVLFQERGTNLHKAVQSMSESGKRIVTALASRYGILSNVRGSSDKKKCVTLSRIAAAHANFCVEVAATVPSKTVQAAAFMNYLKLEDLVLPNAVLCSVLAGCVPKKSSAQVSAEACRDLFLFAECHNYLLSDVINKSAEWKNKPKGQRITDSARFTMTQFRSEWIDDASRAVSLEKAGLVGGGHVANGVHEVAAAWLPIRESFCEDVPDFQ